MKRVITVLAALAFSLSLLAQDTSKPSDNQSQSNQAGQSSQSSQTNPGSTSSQSSQTSPSSTSSSSGSSDQGKRMSGKLSKDAKTFTDDTSGKSYTVSNPDSLQNYENQHVVVLVQTDPDTGNVTITAVQPPQ